MSKLKIKKLCFEFFNSAIAFLRVDRLSLDSYIGRDLFWLKFNLSRLTFNIFQVEFIFFVKRKAKSTIEH